MRRMEAVLLLALHVLAAHAAPKCELFKSMTEGCSPVTKIDEWFKEDRTLVLTLMCGDSEFGIVMNADDSEEEAGRCTYQGIIAMTDESKETDNGININVETSDQCQLKNTPKTASIPNRADQYEFTLKPCGNEKFIVGLDAGFRIDDAEEAAAEELTDDEIAAKKCKLFKSRTRICSRPRVAKDGLWNTENQALELSFGDCNFIFRVFSEQNTEEEGRCTYKGIIRISFYVEDVEEDVEIAVETSDQCQLKRTDETALIPDRADQYEFTLKSCDNKIRVTIPKTIAALNAAQPTPTPTPTPTANDDSQQQEVEIENASGNPGVEAEPEQPTDEDGPVDVCELWSNNKNCAPEYVAAEGAAYRIANELRFLIKHCPFNIHVNYTTYDEEEGKCTYQGNIRWNKVGVQNIPVETFDWKCQLANGPKESSILTLETPYTFTLKSCGNEEIRVTRPWDP